MKRHKKTNRRLTNRLKSTVSVLLVSSMVLNPLNGIQIAIGSELNSTRVTVKGSKADINLSSAALREAAAYAIQNGVTFAPEAYVGLDTATDAAFENLLTQGSSLYELELFDSEDQDVFTEAGIDVKLLIQKDPKAADADLDTEVASASNLKRKTSVNFDYKAKNNRGKEILFYQKGSALDSLIGNFMLEDINHTDLTENAEDNSTYELTGSETVTILYMNTDKSAHTFNLSVDGKAFSGSVKVEGNESAVSKLKKQLKQTAKEELTGTTEATAEVTETSTEATKADTTGSAAADQDNVVVPDTTTAAEDTTAATESAADTTTEETSTTATDTTTEAATKAETQTAEVSQEDTSAKTDDVAAANKTEAKAEDATKEVEQLTSNTVTAIGSFTLQKFFEEGASEEVQTAEEKTAAEDTAEEETTKAEKETEAKQEDKVKDEQPTEAEGTTEDTTAADQEETTTAAEESKTEEGTSASETSAAAETEETTTSETKAITAMDESLAEERQQLLAEQTVEALAENTISAKAVQYTLNDLTADFWSVNLDDAYVVKVYPVDENAIGNNWTLHATELLKEEQTEADAKTSNAETMKIETAEALKEAGIYDNSASLDIHFEDTDGAEVEPNGKVRVEIEVAKEILDEQGATSLSVYHVEEKTDGSVKEVKALDTSTKALDQTGTVISDDKAIVTETVESTEATAVAETEENTAETAATETVTKFSEDVAKVKAEFTVESFSTFTISYSGRRISLKLNIDRRDMDGNDLPAGSLPVSNTSIDLSEVGVPDGYVLVKALYNDKEIFKSIAWANNGKKDEGEREEGWKITYKDEKADYLNSFYGTTTINITAYYQRKEELKTVGTIDSTSQGVHMYLFDYNGSGEYDEMFNPGEAGKYTVEINGKNVSGKTKQGLVYRNLKNGYPMTKASGSTGSLSGYYGGNSTANGVTVVGEVNHLFLADQGNGVFYYNSAENFAHIDTSTKNFTVYEQLGTPNEAGYKFYQRGNFFPFNTLNLDHVLNQNLYKDNGDSLEETNEKYGVPVYGFNEPKDVHFGMKIVTNFYQPKDGLFNDEEMKFEFTGDDCMWVFIDDVLVLDLGGNHDAKTGSINFATGEVKADDASDTTIKAQYEAAASENNQSLNTDFDWEGNTFAADGKLHTMKIFYAESGAGASNLKIKFNLATIPDGSILVNKTVTNLNDAQASDREYTFVLKDESGVVETDKAYKVDGKTTDDQGNELKTDREGKFKLKAGETALFEGFDLNSKWKVEEVTSDLYATSWKIGQSGASQNNASAEVTTKSDPQTVIFTNQAKTFDLTVQKAFTVNGQSSKTAPNDDTFKNTQFALYEKVATEGVQDTQLGEAVSFESFTKGDSNVYSYTFQNLDPTKSYEVKELITKSNGTLENGETNTIKRSKTNVSVNGGTATEVAKIDGNPTATIDAQTVADKQDKTVKFENVYGSEDSYLVIKKTVTGNGYSTSDKFYFQVQIDGNNYNGDLSYVTGSFDQNAIDAKTVISDATAGTVKTANATDGVAKFEGITGGQYIAVKIPNAAGKTVTISELSKENGDAIAVNGETENKYTLKTVSGNEGTLSATEQLTASFTNNKDIPAPTGVHKDILPYVISLGIALAGAALLLLENQRKRQMSR